MTKLSPSLITFLLLFITIGINAQVNPTVLKQIDGLFSQWENKHSPGAAVGVFQNGKILFSKGYGMANLDYDIPIDAASKFYTASVAKQFTAACIALLSIDKKLDLNDAISKYIPEMPEYSHNITINHLLHHTSGLRDYMGIMYLSGRSFEDYYKNDDVVKILSKQKGLNFIPGSQHRYTNSGYVLLAEIVHRVSGMTIREFAEKRLFKPLGMKNTFFKDDRSEIMKNRVIGYKHQGGAVYKRVLLNFDSLGDGNLITTINDMKLWDENFYHKKVGGQKFIDLILTKGILNNGNTISYAFGLFHSNYKGHPTVSHNGNMPGFGIEFLRFPKQKTTVVVMSNSSSINATHQAYKIADMFIKDETKQQKNGTVKKERNSKVLSFKTIKVTPKSLKKFSGLYWNDTNNYSRRIYLKNDTLRYARSTKNESVLVP
ncbi:MAG: beta-lactamase family protein, partial [Flavobacteriaceae bacterium]|nr:beta-lactamase family protein [Flavobacteriaceae bacterium]